MSRIVTAEVIECQGLPERQKRALCHEIFQIFEQLFQGKEEEDFYLGHFHGVKYERQEVIRLEEEGGRMVGFMINKFASKSFEDHPFVMMTSGMGILPQYQANNAAFSVMYKRFWANLLRYRGERLYYFDIMVHPATYHYFQTYGRRVYPHWSRPSDDFWGRLVLQLADDAGYPRVGGADPFVRRTWDVSVVMSEDERERARQSRSPDIQHFVAKTGLQGGCGLLLLFPVTVGNLTWAIPSYAGRRVAMMATRRRRGPPRPHPGGMES